jgi:hypothetical protein
VRSRRTEPTVFFVTVIDCEGLLSSAKDFADRALRAYLDGDERVILVNAAFALEHMSKALLASHHPALMMEIRNGQFDSLLHLMGLGAKARKLTEPKTIGAKEALARVEQMMTIKTPKDHLYRLIEVRDGVVHAGHFNAANTREILTSFLRYSNEVYDELTVPDDDRWESHTNLVSRLITQNLSEVEHRVYRKIEAARNNYQNWIKRVPEHSKSTVNKTLSPGFSALLHRSKAAPDPNEPIQVSAPVECPACKQLSAVYLGHAHGTRRVPEDVIKAGAPTVESLYSSQAYLEIKVLMCSICSLQLLGSDEIQTAGLPARMDIPQEVLQLI